jgi:hypothetical protein
MNQPTISLTELAELANVALPTASAWLRKRLLPAPLPERFRTREYRFDRAAALAAVERILEAKKVLAGDVTEAAAG